MKYLTNSGLSYFLNKIKAYIAAQLNSKANSTHTHSASDITDLPNGYVVDSTLDGTSSNAIANSAVVDALDGKSNAGHTHTKSDITDFPTLATVATSGSYNDLSNKPATMTPTSHTHGNITNDGKIGSNANKPLITTTGGTVTTGSFGTTANTFCQGNDSRLSDARTPTAHTHVKSEITDFPTIPTVNNATLKIQKNGTDIKTFTANASSDVTCNITVPTKTSDLTNDSGFLTSHQSLSNYSTLANTVKSLSISGKTITVTPGSGNAYTLTTQDTVYTHPTSSGNKHIPSGGSSGQFLGWDSDGTAKWVNNPNSDTKNTAGSTDTSSKIFLVGATSQAANPQTYSHDTAYVGTDGCLYSGGTKVLTSHQSLSNYSTLANTIKSLSISGKTITYTKGDNTTGTLTTQDTNTTYSNFVKSGSGAKAGLVPAPSTTAGTTKYLREDGTWQVPPDHTYTVNNATLTIQKNGSNVATFTANASSNVTANISVPTKVSQLTNDSGFITGISWNSVSNKPSTFTPSSHTHTKSQITDFPTIPSKTSQLTNDSGFITSNVSFLEIKGNPPYIDFHSRNSARDYTSRIIDDGDTNTGLLRLVAYYNSTVSQVELYKNYFEPTVDNDIYLGDSTNRWKNIFCATGSISTSDLRLKNTITNIDDSLLDAWENIEPKQYKFNDATEEKGDKARYHTGYLAQDIQTECEKQGVNASDYGLFCYDEWDEQEEISKEIEKEKDGKIVKEKRIIQPKREKGDRYSLRYAEALVVECAYLRKQIKELKERLEKLEGNSK